MYLRRRAPGPQLRQADDDKKLSVGNEVEKHRFDISLEDLQTFIAVANLGGFGRAARHLNLSQPSVSNRVRRLEEKLSVRLLHRTRHRVELTDKGRLLHVQAVETLVGFTSLLQRFHEESQDRKLHVDLASTTLISITALPTLLSNFRDRHGNVTVQLQEFAPMEAMESLLDGRCELAVMACDNLPPTLDHELLVIDHCVVVTSLNHPLHRPGGVTFEETVQHPLLGADWFLNAVHPLASEARNRGIPLHFASQATGAQHPMTLFAMAAAGLGVLIFPRQLILPELASTVALIPFSDCDIQRRYGVVWAKDRPPTNAARRLKTFLCDQRVSDGATWFVQNDASVPKRSRII